MFWYISSDFLKNPNRNLQPQHCPVCSPPLQNNICSQISDLHNESARGKIFWSRSLCTNEQILINESNTPWFQSISIWSSLNCKFMFNIKLIIRLNTDMYDVLLSGFWYSVLWEYGLGCTLSVQYVGRYLKEHFRF